MALPSDSVYQGTDAMLFCCINMDPRTFVNEDGVSGSLMLLHLELVACSYHEYTPHGLREAAEVLRHSISYAYHERSFHPCLEFSVLS